MGKPGAKKTDQIVSATPGDVHIIMVPSPGGPVPTPIPHPCTSIITDGVAEKVKVMGQPGAVKGSTSKHTPPHIPMGPGPFQKPPANKGEIVTASSNVFYEGKAAAMLGDTGKMCADPTDAPVGKVIGTAATVLIGGGGSGSDADREAAAAAALAAAMAAAAHGQNLLAHPTTGHPVDVTTGAVIVCTEDCALDGPLPIQFARTYSSTSTTSAGPLGHGWVHNYLEAIERITPHHPNFADVHGSFVELGAPSPSNVYLAYRQPLGTVTHFHDVPDGAWRFEPAAGGRIARDGDEYVLLTNPHAQHRFAPSTHRTGHFLLTRIVDRHANELRFAYDDAGRLVNISDPFRRSLQLSYDALHRITRLEVLIPRGSGHAGRVWCQYQYDVNGDLVAITDRAGGITQFRYEDHLVVEDRSADGYSFFFQYDDRRRCTHTWGKDGFLTRWLQYDDRRRITWEGNGEGESTFYHYDSASRPTLTRQPGGLALTYTYDDQGRPIERRNGTATEFSVAYDDVGRLVAIDDSVGTSASFAYDEVGRCVAIAAADGRGVEREYDERNNLVGEKKPGTGRLETQFDAFGRPVRRTGPAGTAHYAYDAFGHLRSVVIDPGLALTCGFDPYGRLLWTELDGRITTYEYDGLDRIISRSANGRLADEFAYDFAGHLLRHRNAVSGRVRTFRYAGLRIAEYREVGGDDGEGASVHHRYRYDSEGRLLQVDDAMGVLVRLRYNEAGRTALEEFPADDWGRTRSYDDAGRVCRIDDTDGRSCTLDYDASGNVVRAVYRGSGSGEPLTEVFDRDNTSRIVGAAAGDSTLTFEWDAAGHATAAEQDGWAVESAFDGFGRRTLLHVEGFEYDVEYEYGPGGRLTTLRYGPWVEHVEYAPHGTIAHRRAINGLDERSRFDEEWRFGGVEVTNAGTAGTVYASSYRYDAAGRLADADDTARGRRAFGYQDYRLTGVRWVGSGGERSSAPDESYAFDLRGGLNRTKSGAVRPLAGHRPASLDGPDGPIHLAYDAKGQLVSARDAAGLTWRYRYDALGRRTRKVREGRDGVETRRWEYLWDEDLILAERVIEQTSEGERETVHRLFLYNGAVLCARIEERDDRATAVSVYHLDAAGGPDVCTGGDGSIVWRRQGNAFGFGFAPGDLEQNFGYPGQYFDAETGLFYNRYRHYHPATARFLQPDPVGVNGGWNLHAYPPAPLQASDPLGLATQYNVPKRTGTQHVMLTQDPALLQVNHLPYGIQFTGATQQVTQAAGQNVPRFMGKTHDQFENTPQLVIESHGYPGLVQYIDPFTGTEHWISGRELGRQLHARGFTGDRVVLVVCHAAEPGAGGGGSVAQDLADELSARTGRPIEVIAAGGEVVNLQNGTLVATRPVTDHMGTPVGRMEGFGGVTFQSFSAGSSPRPAPGRDGTNMWPPPATTPPAPPQGGNP